MAKTHDHDPNELIEAAYGATEGEEYYTPLRDT